MADSVLDGVKNIFHEAKDVAAHGAHAAGEMAEGYGDNIMANVHRVEAGVDATLGDRDGVDKQLDASSNYMDKRDAHFKQEADDLFGPSLVEQDLETATSDDEVQQASVGAATWSDGTPTSDGQVPTPFDMSTMLQSGNPPLDSPDNPISWYSASPDTSGDPGQSWIDAAVAGASYGAAGADQSYGDSAIFGDGSCSTDVWYAASQASDASDVYAADQSYGDPSAYADASAWSADASYSAGQDGDAADMDDAVDAA